MIRDRRWTPLTANELKAEGWLRRQLRIQADGLSGNLDKVWPDIRDSKWIGGTKDGWERVPYWLDGFIPLAYLLDDEDMKQRAQKYIDGILQGQAEDGWICPCKMEERGRYDVWAAFLICKVLVVYYECSGDERIEEVVYRALKQLFGHICGNTLFGWGAARWFECLIPLFWLYERRPEPWMMDFAYVLEGTGFDYEKLYKNLAFERPDKKRYWTFLNHVVNVAMALKSRSEMSRITGEDPDEFALFLYEQLTEKHGMANWHFTGDECLAGKSPVQGTELCGVVEAMYSYEELLSISGNPYWGDLLERLAFNALPAAISPDMWSHQYDQLTNQVECTKIPEEAVPFNSNNGEAHNFGLEPNFGCCTANFNQGWPKFALSAVMKAENAVAITAIAPVCARIKMGENEVSVQVKTEYPFKDTAEIEVSTLKRRKFSVYIRIPSFARRSELIIGNEVIEAEPGTFYKIEKVWNKTESIKISFEFETEYLERPKDMKAVVRGPLLYALPISEKWEKVEYEKEGVVRKFPYCDYKITPQSAWNYAFAGKEFCVKYNGISEYPFSAEKPPVQIAVDMVQIPWEKDNGICKESPETLRALGSVENKCLQPYGCTNLRMTEMPYLG